MCVCNYVNFNQYNCTGWFNIGMGFDLTNMAINLHITNNINTEKKSKQKNKTKYNQLVQTCQSARKPLIPDAAATEMKAVGAKGQLNNH